MPNLPKTWHPAGDRRARRQRYDRQRAPDHSFYSGKRWRKLRAIKLRANPLCEYCLQEGVKTIATVVDHAKDRRERPDLAYELDNLKSSCKRHHDSRTAKEHWHGKRQQ